MARLALLFGYKFGYYTSTPTRGNSRSREDRCFAEIV